MNTELSKRTRIALFGLLTAALGVGCSTTGSTSAHVLKPNAGATDGSAPTPQEIAQSLVEKGKSGMQRLVSSPTTLTKEEVRGLLDDVEMQVQEGLNGNQGLLSSKEIQMLFKDINTEKQKTQKRIRVIPPRQANSTDSFSGTAMSAAQQAIEENVRNGRITREEANQLMGAAVRGVQQGTEESVQRGYIAPEQAEQLSKRANAATDAAQILNAVKDEKEKALVQFRAIASRK